MKRRLFGQRNIALAWSIAAILSLAVGFFVVSAPKAYAQSSSGGAASQLAKDDSRRYAQLLQTIYQFIVQNYVEEVDPSALYQGAMKGMLDSLGDPHSTFLDEAMLSDFMRDTDGVYAGVGLYISKPLAPRESGAAESGSYVEVVSPIEDTPGWKAGVMPGDLILAIDGEDTSKLTVDQASAKIRGKEGTKVTLKFRRGSSFEFEFEFVRAVIEIPSIKTALIPSGNSYIGYIRIIEWMPQTAGKVEAALRALESQLKYESKAPLFIIDVRSNPGGLLSSVVDVSDLFLGSGTIVSTKGRNPQENAEYGADAKVSIPEKSRIVVLINKGSASASEIFAGAMKDTRRALLVGEKTYGKGSVQQIFPIDETGFKLTMARYYTPSGVNIDKKGIVPDIEVADFIPTDAQFEVLERLYDSGLILAFAKDNPNATIADRAREAEALAAKGYDLPVSYLSRLLKIELERTQPTKAYDLEFDIQLNKAIEVLQGQGFEDLLLKSKTLSEIMASK
jgi:carboxyl-terminal processing protease